MKKIFFIGNRASVFKEIEHNCEEFMVVKIVAVQDSFLSRYLDKQKKKYIVLDSKEDLIDEIKKTEFDYLISNGCPYILPISKLKKSDERYINIHPSLLPELKGKHPINGAYLLNKPFGVTCHYMNDKVDDGEIIAQINVGMPYSINLEFAYKLLFRIEGEVFKKSIKCGFKVTKQIDNIKDTYYSRDEKDLIFNFNMDIDEILKIIKAFSIESIMSRFYYKDRLFKVLDADVIKLDYLEKIKEKFRENEIIYVLDNDLIIKKSNKILHLKHIEGQMDTFKEEELLI